MLFRTLAYDPSAERPYALHRAYALISLPPYLGHIFDTLLQLAEIAPECDVTPINRTRPQSVRDTQYPLDRN